MPPAHDPPWYQRAFGADYAERYAHRDGAEAARSVEALVAAGHLPAQGRILDLGCGAGRHWMELIGRGFQAVGFDLSKELLAIARRRALETGRRAPLARGDMRALPFSTGAFAALIQMFTAFGYFEDDADNRAVLAEAARVLRPGGTYALDLPNPERTIATLVPRSTRQTPLGTLVETRRFDPVRRRLEKTVVGPPAPGAPPAPPLLESVRLLAVDEAREWLAAAGFTSVSLHGDYALGPFGPATSERLLLVASRAPS